MGSRLFRLALWLLLVAVPVGLSVVVSTTAAHAQAATKTFGLKITRVHCHPLSDETCLEALGSGEPDFYGKIFFEGREHKTPTVDGDFDTEPNWVATEEIPATQTQIDMAIQIWDADGVGQSDELADVTPRSGDRGRNLEFRVDLATGHYTGDITSPQGCARGNGDGDVEVCFEVVFSANGDADGDGLTDGQETRGIDNNLDGNVDFVLPGANHLHKDMYIEADWVERANPGAPNTSFAPNPQAIPDVVAAFANAPVANPDGRNGITMHAGTDEAIVVANTLIFFHDRHPLATDDFDDFKLDRNNGAGNCPGTFGTAAERTGPNCARVLAAKKLVYRYMWFSERYAEDTNSSGNSELNDKGGNDFIVTFPNGSRDDQAGTFMHELGHDLGLGHGGRTADGHVDNTNCKPNYLSVMSYTRQTNASFSGTTYTRRLEYAFPGLPELNESALDENQGVRGPAGEQTVFSLPTGVPEIIPAGGTVNWNNAAPGNPPTPIETGTVAANINNFARIIGCASAAAEVLTVHDDWSNLHYELDDSPLYADGVARPRVEELTRDTITRMTPPDAQATISGPADTTAGASVPVNATATNVGKGNAPQASLTITQPGPVTNTWQVGPLTPGAAQSRQQQITVPCAAADLSTVVSTATVTATGDLGQADNNAANNTAELTTTVHKPVPTLAVAAPPAGLSGEAIPVILTYGNSGSAAATGLVATVVLPNEVYYSTANDPAGSPRPTSVDRRPDGTTELRWQLADLPAGAPAGTVQFSVRPSLLMAPGTQVVLAATMSSNAANDCPALSVTTQSTTAVSVPPKAGPAVPTPIRALATDTWTAETLARIQATDQRFDGADRSTPDGGLGTREIRSVYGISLDLRAPLRAELSTLYFNLAERHFNSDSELNLQIISPILTTPETAGEAARQAQQLLDAPDFDLVAATKLLVVLEPLNLGLLT